MQYCCILSYACIVREKKRMHIIYMYSILTNGVSLSRDRDTSYTQLCFTCGGVSKFSPVQTSFFKKYINSNKLVNDAFVSQEPSQFSLHPTTRSIAFLQQRWRRWVMTSPRLPRFWRTTWSLVPSCRAPPRTNCSWQQWTDSRPESTSTAVTTYV